ncbi:adenosylcobinamide-GDP ribazoletransferase [Brevibacillus humidisoli]|uniref:adenosylcobinamide-GDP ribazoletransferase n=1 Tax=Brevibacillus humidisoli TaxID=2895522 RepID=UPI001E391988|nr:adenosylcobinamide-GDP ribazoletransferase [Brevibacillus humidisoli]UFJ41470.1 adenosylcobinamide-GDP ribazoletransferase [Brevibacillus humidisoli]
MGAFFQAISFLTRLPVPRYPMKEADWSRSAVFYPLVGAIIGLLLWGGNWFSELLLSDHLAAVLTLIFWIYITGGLHLDGWMDLADGLGSSRPREQVLTIMKDSRVGAMGVLAALSLLLVKGAAIYELLSLNLQTCLVIVPAIARTHLLIAIRHWPYLTQDGIGSRLREGIGTGHLLVSSIAVLSVGWWAVGYQNMLVFLLTLLYLYWFSTYIHRRLGGYTGDAYGALIESTEAVALLLLVAADKWLP